MSALLPRLSNGHKAALAVALALLLWAPQGISHGDHTMLTGHSTFYDGAAYSPCLGSIAGIMRHRVMWFNDQVLVETYGGKGTYIHFTEAGAEDPRDKEYLFTEGVFYDFVDPNGAHWHVEEMFYTKIEQSSVISPNDLSVNGKPLVESLTAKENRTYVWSVELAARPIYDDFAGDDPHSYYNFLTIVDTCKMHNTTATYDGEEIHDVNSGKLNDRNGHPNADKEHQHGRFMVDIWVGKRIVSVPLGASSDGAEFETQWAQSQTNDEIPEDGPDGGTMPELP